MQRVSLNLNPNLVWGWTDSQTGGASALWLAGCSLGELWERLLHFTLPEWITAGKTEQTGDFLCLLEPPNHRGLSEDVDGR